MGGVVERMRGDGGVMGERWTRIAPLEWRWACEDRCRMMRVR